MPISDRIKYYRTKHHLKQSQLAELIGVSSQTVSKWETGAGCPDVSILVPLAKALRTTTDQLLEYDAENKCEEWDSAALAYELFNSSFDSYSYTIEWPCIQKLLPEIRGKSVLDVGCGTGIFTFLLEQYYPANNECDFIRKKFRRIHIMLKKIRRIVALVLTFVMLSSMTVLAAESNQKLSVQPEDMTEQSETLETRAAAPAVSSVKIESAYIDSNTNHVIVVV